MGFADDDAAEAADEADDVKRIGAAQDDGDGEYEESGIGHGDDDTGVDGDLDDYDSDDSDLDEDYDDEDDDDDYDDEDYDDEDDDDEDYDDDDDKPNDLPGERFGTKRFD